MSKVLKKCLAFILLGGGGDLVIFENLNKSLEDMCNGIPTRKDKVHVSCTLQKRTSPRNLFPAFFFTMG